MIQSSTMRDLKKIDHCNLQSQNIYMDISLKYNFLDFTLINYSRLLNIALQNYSFRIFTEELVRKSILLRHDVEFSIPITLQMAEIEANMGIKATYFVQLHSEFYNTLEKKKIF